MKAVTLSILGLVAATSAYNQPKPYHFQFKRDNSTASGAATGTVASNLSPDFTTLTVAVTEVKTIISCAETVTDCPADETAIANLPADAQSTIIVTNTVVLTETVCPKTEASAIASSVVSDAEQGKITGVTLTATNVAVPTGTEITTTRPFSTIGNSGEDELTTTEPTTTITMTSKVTATITVIGDNDDTATSDNSAVVTSTPANGNGGSPNEGSDDSTCDASTVIIDTGNCACNGATATVTLTMPAKTVTEPAKTVYVTMVPQETEPVVVNPGTSNTATADPAESTGEAGDDEGDDCPAEDDEAGEEEGDDYPVEDEEPTATETVDATSSDVIVEETATVVPVPMYPSNGTHPDGAAGATGTVPGTTMPTGAYRHRSHRFSHPQ